MPSFNTEHSVNANVTKKNKKKIKKANKKITQATKYIHIKIKK